VTWSLGRRPYTSLVAALMTRCSGAVVEKSVAIVQSSQHERCHDVGGDVTTEQTPNLTQASQLKEASLRHLGHVSLYARLTVKVDAEVAY